MFIDYKNIRTRNCQNWPSPPSQSINAIKFAVSEFLEQEADGAKFIPHLVGRDVRPFQRATKRDGPSRKRKGMNLLLLTYGLS